jgi:hypothetical protein
LVRPDVDLIDEPHGGTEIPKQAKIELRMNLSLLEMLKGNTNLEDLANLREQWIEPLEEIIRQLQDEVESDLRHPTSSMSG